MKFTQAMRKIVFLLFFSTVVLVLQAQWQCVFTHYSSDDGLSQNSIMNIIEDKKGYLWFATWDGINKFDGYTFKTYKSSESNNVTLTNNRVDFMAEDSLGYIWLLTYDNRVYRFNPSTELFQEISDTTKTTVSFTAISILNDRHVWLLTEQDGACRVTIDPETAQFALKTYSKQNGTFPTSEIHAVTQDAEGNQWLLSENGLGMIAPGEEQPSLYFTDTQSSFKRQKQTFFCMEETAESLFFGTMGGRIWICDKPTKTFRLLHMNTHADILHIKKIDDKALIVATRNDGFFYYTIGTDAYTHYSTATTPRLPGNKVLSVYVDREKEIWFNLEDAKGVTHFNPFTNSIKQEILEVEEGSAYRSQPAFRIHEDVNGYLWVHPFNGGLSVFDRGANSLRPFFNEPGSKEWRFSNKVHAMMSDRQGNLWMCTHSKGLEKISFFPDLFKLEQPTPLNYESLSNDVRSLFEDNQSRLWMGLRDGKIRIYDQDKKFLGFLTKTGSLSKNGEHILGVAYHIMQDSEGIIWIATKGDGLIRAKEQDGRFDLTQFRSDPDDLYSLSDNNLYSLHEDKNGRLWIATFGGGVNYIEEREDGKIVFINHLNNLKGYPIDECYRARTIYSDSKGTVWVGTTSGLVAFESSFTTPETIVFRHYKRSPGNPESLSNNDVYWIKETQEGELYFGTFGGGLNRLKKEKENENIAFESFTTNEGLPNDILLSVQEDSHGNLWLSTENGLCKFIPHEKKMENYNDRRLDIKAGFNEAASLRLEDGSLLFGTSNGVLSFFPDEIAKSAFIPPLTLSKLQINNEEVRPGNHSKMRSILDDMDKLVLSHKENILSIHYAAIDAKAPENIRYAYILEGFDQEWSYVDKQRVATYTNLPKGDYVFRVKSTNNDGVWVANERTLPITIRPSFWETPWAFMLYVLVVLGIIFVAVYILFTIFRLKREVSVEQQVSDIKLRFFTNISHELRTPLTLIAGPLEYVMKNTPQTPEAMKQLQLVERNTDRMLRLVNQILDFRKIQNKKMKLRVQRVEVVSFVKSIMSNFDVLAEEHKIDFMFEHEKEQLYLWADADKLEKIIFNLLSNAFKYTPVGKMIKVFIRENEQTISLGVQDQGIGIPANKKDSLFVRFENIVDKNLFSNQSSTGIGLSLVKDLVEMHHGKVSVDTLLGEGSTFSVELKKGKDHFDETVEFILADHAVKSETPKEEPGETSKKQIATTRDESPKQVMLLIEDNDELRSFLKTVFASDFRIAEAVNGKEGAEKALMLIPDIIISDVMMPEQDGFELTRVIKDNLSTSHIPIILLTAKTALENRLEGLKYGADDYITKPFSSVYLKARVENLLAQHKKFREHYRSTLMAPASESEKKVPVDTTGMSQNDQNFLNKLVEIMEENMDNGDLVVEDLVKDLAVSRSVFFKKLKALTGLAPIEFIREMRVRRAAEYIETGNYSMSQIAYMVGINDPRYFSKCFKQQFGMTPTEYKEQKLHGNGQNIHTRKEE